MKKIDTLAELEALYGIPNEASTAKEVAALTPDYEALIGASPFAVFATCGPDGLDASPRGDLPGFVRIVDAKTLQFPDRRGNNRIDSLRNVIHDPHVALLFLIPGSGTTLRVNGRAALLSDPDVLESFAFEGHAPRVVVEIAIDTVFFQCARAVVRSHLWDPSTFADPASLPTPGAILAALTGDRVGGKPYDDEWPERARKTLW
jgi:PPOX class probable FMN-dependent enzyme